MTFRVALAVAALLLPAAALAQQTPVSGVTVEASKAQKISADEDRVVCKRLTPSGSRLPGKKVCKTQGEWSAESAAAKEELDDLTRRSRGVNQVAGG